MFKLIIGGLIGAAIVAVCYTGKLNNAESEKESMKQKYNEEKQRRKDSNHTAERYKTENSILKDELKSERNKNSSTKTAHLPPKTVVLKKTETDKTDEEALRCIRL